MSINEEKLKTLPDAPGVYFFLGPKTRKVSPWAKLSTKSSGKPVEKPRKVKPCGAYGREVLYIGKAGSLRDRVRSYFARDIAEARGAGIRQMVLQAEDIAYEKTDSVLEAVLLEAELIKKYQPKYNVREKDDKSFNYVAITDEDFPRVLTIRGKELIENEFAGKQKSKISVNHKSYIINLKSVFGPFPQSGTLREALSIIRKIFPYRDRCIPLAHRSYSSILQNTRIRKPCFNRQIGLCPGVCTGEISKQEYARTIRNIALLFRGKKKAVLRALARDMKDAAKRQEFEDAGKIRNTMFALEHIQDISLIKREPRNIYNGRPPVYMTSGTWRIEAYDIAHTSGKEIVGVIAVVHHGESEKSAYRKFKLRGVASANDTAALKEVLERRLAHPEWQFPQIVVVDGGKAQMNVATRVLEEAGVPAQVVGVVKNEYHKPKRIDGDRGIITRFEDEILLANSEAHRFAISFHRERMRKRS